MSRREGLVKKFSSMSASFSLRDLTKRGSTLSSLGDNSMHSMNNSMHSLGNTSHRLRRGALTYGPSIRGSGGAEARTSVKSIMKVHSLEDSLRTSEEKNKKKRSILLGVLAPPALRRGSSAADKVTNILQAIIRPGHHRNMDASGKTDLCDSDDEGGNELAESTHDSKHVSFSSIHIRNFKSEVSDNPGVSSGPAMGIGWEYTQAPAVDFEAWEAKRSPRLQMKEMVLSRSEREARLRAQGVTTAELAKMTKSITVAKKKRKRTLEMMSKHHRLEETLENMSLRMKKLVGARKNDEDEEDELWTEANKGTRRSSSLKDACIPYVGVVTNTFEGGAAHTPPRSSSESRSFLRLRSSKKLESEALHSPPSSSSLRRLAPTLPSLKASSRMKSIDEAQDSPSSYRPSFGLSDSRAADIAAGPSRNFCVMQDTSANKESNDTCKRAIQPKAEIISISFGDQDFADF